MQTHTLTALKFYCSSYNDVLIIHGINPARLPTAAVHAQLHVDPLRQNEDTTMYACFKSRDDVIINMIISL